MTVRPCLPWPDKRLRTKAGPVTEITEEPWGRLVAITLPGGGDVGVYEPRHERPE